MPTSTPVPLRVLVKGASTVNWVSWMGGPRQDFIFPRVIEQELLAAGRDCHVQAVTRVSERTVSILGSWQDEVLGYSPDVIVLVYGHYETIHLFLPHWLEVHANSFRGRPRAYARAYRRLVLRPAWRILARVQAKVDTSVPPTVRRRDRTVAADLREYIGHVQKVGSPLVLVLELLPPGTRYRSWFPGMTRRIEVMNRTLHDLVTGLGRDNVRYVRVGEIVDEHIGDLDTAVPDGFHYSPELHRHVGARLAREIDAWASTQTHLTPGSGG
ncbi:MAG: hypothetical protein ABW004_12985 [Aeromicrobium sp.]